MKKALLAIALFLSISCASLQNKPAIPSNVPLSQRNVIELALKSVGHLEGFINDEDGIKHSTGCSAFSIAARKFLTAAHCIDEDMTLDGRSARVIKVDIEKDLAIILVDDVRTPLSLRQRLLERFENVFGLGYGYSWTRPTVSWNRVLILHYQPAEYKDIYPGTWFQGGFIGGMSGGPIVDEDGLVVGVVQRGDGQTGYGVDVSTIQEFLEGAEDGR